MKTSDLFFCQENSSEVFEYNGIVDIKENNLMAYIFKKMDNRDFESIRKELNEKDKNKLYWLNSNRFFDSELPVNWAIDLSTGNYMFIVPTSREDSANSHFYACLGDVIYEISVDGLFGNEVCFEDKHPVSNNFEMVKVELSKALAVLGRFGSGVNDSIDIVVAEFKGDK